MYLYTDYRTTESTAAVVLMDYLQTMITQA